MEEWRARILYHMATVLEDNASRSRNQGVSLEGKLIHTREVMLVRKQHCVECFPDVPTDEIKLASILHPHSLW